MEVLQKKKNSPIDKSHKQLKRIQIVGAKNGEKNKQGSENNIHFTHVLKVAKWKWFDDNPLSFDNEILTIDERGDFLKHT